MRATSPLDSRTLESLNAGDIVTLSGVVYTARDQAHKRLCAALVSGAPLPVDLRDQTVFYAGPAPTPPGAAVGSLGPTTSARMDPFTPALLEYGVRAMIGKGRRSEAVVDAMRAFGAVYFVATGGAAAFLAQFVRRAEVVAYEDLGPEAIRRLEIEDMPLVVGVDSKGVSCLWPDIS